MFTSTLIQDNITLGELFSPQVLPYLLIVVIFSYLVGSLNFSLIVCKVLAKEDVRNFGSGNAGMTNMLRTYGKGAAVLTTLGDFTKGIICVFLARLLFYMVGLPGAYDIGYIAGFTAMIGHLYPVFFGFKGGKGVLTAFGIILALSPMVFLALFAVFVPMAFITRIVSLASVLGAAFFPVLNYLYFSYYDRPMGIPMFFTVVLAGFILYSHRANIKRLLNGTENRFGSKPKEENK